MNTSRQRRTQLVGTAALAATGLLLAGCGGGTAGSETADGNVGIGITPSVNNATMNLAVDAELGEPYGVELERNTVGGAGSTNQVAALLSGDLDVAVGGTNTIVDAVAQGADIQIIAGLAPLLFSLTLSDDAADASGVSPDAPIDERIEALRGQRIAVSPSGSTGNIVLRTILEDAGLDPDNDATFVPLNDLGAIPSGLIQGTFDASFAAVGTGEVAVASGDAVTWVSIPQGDIEALENYKGIVAYSSGEYIENNPENIEAVVNAVNDAERMTVDEPDEAGGILKETIFDEMAQDEFDETWAQVQGTYTEGGLFTEQDWTTIQEVFDGSSEHDYSGIAYDDLVAEIARG